MRSWSSQRRSRCKARRAPVKPPPMMPMVRATALPVDAGGTDMRCMLRCALEAERARDRARMQRVMGGDPHLRRALQAGRAARDLPARESRVDHCVEDDEAKDLG